MAGPVAPWTQPGPLGPETDEAYLARWQREAAEQAAAAARASQGAFGSLGAPARPKTFAELEAEAAQAGAGGAGGGSPLPGPITSEGSQMAPQGGALRETTGPGVLPPGPPAPEPGQVATGDVYGMTMAPQPQRMQQGISGGGGGYGYKPRDTGAPFYGGLYLPEKINLTPEWEAIDLAEQRGELTSDQATAKRNALVEQWQQVEQSVPGQMVQYQRMGQRGELERMGIEGAMQGREAGRFEEMGGEYARRANEALRERRATEMARERIQGRTNAIIAEQERAIRDIGKMKVDPEQGYEAVGGRFVAAIATALGAISSGLTGQPNLAYEHIQRTLDRHIEAQRTAIENAKDATQMRGSILGQLNYQLGDLDAAEQAYRAFANQQIALEADRLGQLSQGDQAKTTAATISSLAKQTGQQFEAGLKISAQQQAEQEEMLRRQAIAASYAQAQRRAQQEAMGGYGEMDPKLAETVVWSPQGGAIGMLPPGTRRETVEKVQEMVADNSLSIEEVDRLIQLADAGASGAMPMSQAAGEFAQRFQLIRAPLKKNIAGAAENEQEAAAINSMVLGTGMGLTDRAMGLTSAALRRYRDRLDRERQTKIGAYGGRPVDVQTVPDFDKPGRSRYYIREGGQAQGSTVQMSEGVAPK